MLPIPVILDRFTAMYHVAQVIQSGWIWTIMSLAEMGSNLANIRAYRDMSDTASADMLEARSLLDGELSIYRTSLRAFLRVGKLRYRGTPSKKILLKPLVMEGTGRDATLATGSKIEKAWKKTGQTFVPVPGVTYALTHDCGVRALQLMDDYELKQTEWRDKIEQCQDLASALDHANIEWYATATTVFPAGTRFGDLIRTMVPTNNKSVRPVAPAVIDVFNSPSAGLVHLEFHAAHATSYRIWHKPPGGVSYVLLSDNVDGLTFDLANLTAPGQHRFQVAGQNSRGLGEVSAEVVVNVTVAAAA